jgi:hypothetical protein
MNCEIETELERVNYFQGQLLSAADLQVEQEYFLARLRRHNRYMLGWGVVSGLTVTTASSTEVVVEPGLAIDCVGNEIHMCAEVRLPVARVPDTQFVVIRYAETKTSPIPLASVEAISAGGELAYSRIREGFFIEVVGTDPTSSHRGKGTGTPGCGRLHGVCIARLKKTARSWKVEQRGGRRA